MLSYLGLRRRVRLLAAEVQRWDLDPWPKDALHSRQRPAAEREPFINPVRVDNLPIS